MRIVMKVKRIRNTIHIASNTNPCPGSNKAEIEIETFAFCATSCPAHIPDLIQTKPNAKTLLSCVSLLLIFLGSTLSFFDTSRFYIKCTACVSEICFRTDPESCDYVLEAGDEKIVPLKKQ